MSETIEKTIVKDVQTKKNHTGPFLIMVALFFVVGFLTVVNQQFQVPLKGAFLGNAGEIKDALATMLTFAFFLGYPATSGIGAKWVENKGYKMTLVNGLIMLVFGLGIFELSAWSNSMLPSVSLAGGEVPLAFFVFLIGSFVVGCALAILQIVINPYLTACIVPGTTAVTRMSIGGSSNSTGTTLAPLFVTYIVFAGAEASDVQIGDIYIPLGALLAFVAVLAFIIPKLNLPNIGSQEEKEDAEPVKLDKSVWSFSHLKLGVVAIFMYVGVEVCVGANLGLYIEQLIEKGEFPDAVKLLWFDGKSVAILPAIYWFSMLVGRLCGSFLSKIAGTTQLLVTAGGATVLVIAGMLTANPWLLVAVGLLHSIMWGAIFALAIDKLGPYTSKGSGALMIGVVGGALMPLFQGILASSLGSWDMTWFLVIAGELYLVYYALVGYKHNLD
ncbi:MFS transporter [Flammeovirga aprica]|uniref:MFS transporter n=1 Tax=Flammeovirga aprica TaxID=29528 RepID=UPI001980E345|nr:MFS transporter [Flammeovirga aprica]